MSDKKTCTKDELLNRIEQEKPELLITMGAGDIDRFVEPLEKMIKTW
jgi:UDP-N-acetylmuramate--alanine ligase